MKTDLEPKVSNRFRRLSPQLNVCLFYSFVQAHICRLHLQSVSGFPSPDTATRVGSGFVILIILKTRLSASSNRDPESIRISGIASAIHRESSQKTLDCYLPEYVNLFYSPMAKMSKNELNMFAHRKSHTLRIFLIFKKTFFCSSMNF